MKRKKYGWTALGIIGFIFTPIGLFFTVLGGVVGKLLSAAWENTDDSVIFVAVFCGVGGLFLLLGLIFLYTDLRRRHLLRRAYESGNRVDAKIIGFSEISSVNSMNGHPNVVECAYTDTCGVVHIYRSRYLNINIAKLLQSDTVPVYIDRENENVGFVDIDAILPEIRIH